MVPFIGEGNLVRNGKKIGDIHIWNAQNDVLLLDEQSGELWVLENKEIQGKVGGCCVEDDGVSAIVQRNGEFYHVKYTTKTE